MAPHLTSVLERRATTGGRWLPVVVVVLACALVLIATARGVGISPDSTQYLSTADHFAMGEGLRVHWWARRDVPQTHFPPLYPIVLGSLQWVGVSPLDAALVINLLSLITTLGLVGYLVRRGGAASPWAPVLAMTAVALSRGLLDAHAMVWTEPAFIAMSLGTMALLARGMRNDQLRWIAAAGLLAGAATITRYVGIALIGTCGLGILLWSRVHLARRVRQLVVFGLIAGGPLALWFLRNAIVAGTAANRRLELHLVNRGDLQSAANTLMHWIVPDPPYTVVETAIVGFFGAASVIYAGLWLRDRWRKAPSSPRQDTEDFTVARLLALYVAAYVAFIALTISVADAQTSFGPRIMSAIIPPVAIVAAIWLSLQPRTRDVQSATAILTGTLLLALSANVGEWAVEANRVGLGYNSTQWRESKTIDAVRAMPANAEISSNFPDAILFLTGREVAGLPRLGSPTSLLPNERFESLVRRLCQRAQKNPTMIVHFTRDPAWFLPSLARVRSILGSRPIHVFDDGVIDIVPATCARDTNGTN